MADKKVAKFQAYIRGFLTRQKFYRQFIDRTNLQTVPDDIIISTTTGNQQTRYKLNPTQYKHIRGNTIFEDECLPFAGEYTDVNIEMIRNQLEHMQFCSVHTIDRNPDWKNRYLREKTYTLAQEKKMAQDMSSIPNQCAAMKKALSNYRYGKLVPTQFMIRTDKTSGYDNGSSRTVIYSKLKNLGHDTSAVASRKKVQKSIEADFIAAMNKPTKPEFMDNVDVNEYTAPHPLDPTQGPNATAKEIASVYKEIEQAKLQFDLSEERKKVSLCCIDYCYCYALYV